MFEVTCKNDKCEIVDFINKFVNNPIPVICGTCGELPEVTETREVWVDPLTLRVLEAQGK